TILSAARSGITCAAVLTTSLATTGSSTSASPIATSNDSRHVRYTPAALAARGSAAPPARSPMQTLDLWSMLFVFMLATFVGFQVIQNVSRLLHTPLMSLTNAISAIAIVGSIIIAGEEKTVLSTVLGGIAVSASTPSIVSGF